MADMEQRLTGIIDGYAEFCDLSLEDATRLVRNALVDDCEPYRDLPQISLEKARRLIESA